MEHTTHCCKALLIAGEWPRMSAESLDYPTTTATVIEWQKIVLHTNRHVLSDCLKYGFSFQWNSKGFISDKETNETQNHGKWVNN